MLQYVIVFPETVATNHERVFPSRPKTIYLSVPIATTQPYHESVEVGNVVSASVPAANLVCLICPPFNETPRHAVIASLTVRRTLFPATIGVPAPTAVPSAL